MKSVKIFEYRKTLSFPVLKLEHNSLILIYATPLTRPHTGYYVFEGSEYFVFFSLRAGSQYRRCPLSVVVSLFEENKMDRRPSAVAVNQALFKQRRSSFDSVALHLGFFRRASVIKHNFLGANSKI